MLANTVYDGVITLLSVLAVYQVADLVGRLNSWLRWHHAR